MRSFYLRVEKWTTTFSMLIACLMLTLAACLGILQIFTRFVLETPVEWTEVIIRFSLIWMVFMGIPMAFRQGSMVSVDVLYRWSGPRMKKILDTAVALAALVLVGITLAQTAIGENLKGAVKLSLVKNFVHPLLMAAAGYAMGMRGLALSVMVVPSSCLTSAAWVSTSCASCVCTTRTPCAC